MEDQSQSKRQDAINEYLLDFKPYHMELQVAHNTKIQEKIIIEDSEIYHEEPFES